MTRGSPTYGRIESGVPLPDRSKKRAFRSIWAKMQINESIAFSGTHRHCNNKRAAARVWGTEQDPPRTFTSELLRDGEDGNQYTVRIWRTE